MSKTRFAQLLIVLLVLSLVLSACTGAATTAAPATEKPMETEEPMATEEPMETEEPEPAGEAIEIRWYIGLGAGGNPEQIEQEDAFVEKFNEKYGDKYILVTDIQQNDVAYDVLKTQIAGGEAPDIVGPVGVKGLYSFEGAWLDLTSLIDSTSYDLSDFNPALVDFYKLGPQGQIALPFGVYPSALWYNKDLFDEAGLEYPPHEWGGDYSDGDAWDYDKVRELAMLLTVDANGNDATSPDFDPENIVQFGYDAVWTDPRGMATFFKAGNFIADDGKTAVMPDGWADAFQWYYDAMWVDHFMPTDPYRNSELLANGNTFSSGAVAMMPQNSWYTCCFDKAENWDVGAIPSYNGEITAKLHADTFAILADSEKQEAAFEVLGLFLGEFAPDLLQIYGAFPARASLQEDAMATMAESYPDVDLQVLVEALNYPDNPNHEAGLPNILKANDRIGAFQTLIQSTPDLDLQEEMDKLIADLQQIYDEAE